MLLGGRFSGAGDYVFFQFLCLGGEPADPDWLIKGYAHMRQIFHGVRGHILCSQQQRINIGIKLYPCKAGEISRFPACFFANAVEIDKVPTRRLLLDSKEFVDGDIFERIDGKTAFASRWAYLCKRKVGKFCFENRFFILEKKKVPVEMLFHGVRIRAGLFFQRFSQNRQP